MFKKKEVDPVCNMKVKKKTAPAKAEYEGKEYFFCAQGCKEKFEKEPEKYLKEAKN